MRHSNSRLEFAQLRFRFAAKLGDVGRNEEEFANRVTALEHRVSKAQQDASAARALAGAADRDCSEFRRTQLAHTKVLNALRETQIEQGGQLAEHGRILREHGRSLREHGRMLREHGRILDKHSTILQEHTSMLTEHGQRLGALETKVDSGFTKVNIGMDHIATLLQRVLDKN